jgi:mannose-6-phosphate isomerase-like protein (cupin superfamily)
MPVLEPLEMITAEPLPGWRAHFFHAESMTFALYDLAADAMPLHEHQHPQEEVWNVVEGEVVISIAGVEHTVRAGGAAIVPPDTPHSARVLTAARVVVADHPRRDSLPGVSAPEG